MIYNLVRSAALAWLLHAGIGLVFDGGSEAASEASLLATDAASEASVFFSAVPASCAMPRVESAAERPSSASPEPRSSLIVSPLSLIPRAARDAFDLRILPNAARALRSTIPTFAGAQS